jgi:hypothetical protein
MKRPSARMGFSILFILVACGLVGFELFEVCTLDGDLRRQWAVIQLRNLGLKDRSREGLLALMKRYARQNACSLAAWDGAVR